MVLKKIFLDITRNYTGNPELIEKLWDEIDKNYSSPGRYYHTLLHLDAMISQLEEVRTKILDWDLVLFTVFYHDIIYEPIKTNNEEKSAELARRRLSAISFPENKISKCFAMILATKNHSQTGDSDTDYFTDADLSILGQPWDEYSTYIKQIRKEYAVFPDLIYNSGRKKVLNQFLQMDRIYKSDYFYKKFESKARENLLRERELY